MEKRFKKFFFIGMVSFIALLLQTSSLRAEQTPDPSAPIDQKPIIDSAPNNTPVVQIAAPNDKGVSHNRYDTFNVGPNGTILNNNSNPTQTQLGGYIVGNNRLRPGESARVILNEVRGSRASLLQGFLEVAGNRAEVIVANPNGITCNGCGFLNVSRGTLTTGTPIWSNGDISGFDVRRGEIVIEGNGLNGLETDRVALLSEAIRINAGVWANEVDAVAGQNQIDNNSLDAHSTTSEKRTGVSIDISSLGGMYANKIKLVGTQNGMGVRSAGNIASAGEFTISSDGRVELSGKTHANAIHIKARDKVSNTGTVTSGGTIHIQAHDIEQQGIAVAGIQSDGTLGQNGDFILEARDHVLLNQTNWAANQFIIDANSIDIEHANLYSKGDMQWIAHQGDIKHLNSNTSANRFSLQAQGAFVNQESTLQANSIFMFADSLNNTYGTLQQLGTDTFYGIFSEGLLNNSGTIASNGSLYLQAKALQNNSGELLALGGNLTLVLSDSLQNKSGFIGSAHDIAIHARSIDSTQVGKFTAAGSLGLDIKDDVNLESAILQVGNHFIVDAASLVTSHSTVTVNGTAIMTVDDWNNAYGEFWSSSLIANGLYLNNQYGKLYQTSPFDSELNFTQGIDNAFGMIASNANNLSIKTLSLNNASGQIAHAGDEWLSIYAGQLNNEQGSILSNQHTALSVFQQWQHFGTLNVGGDFNFEYIGDFVLDSDWHINGNANFSTTGTWTQQGKLEVAGDLNLYSHDFFNSGEIKADSILISAQHNLINEHVINGGVVRLIADQIINHDSVIAINMQIEANDLLNETPRAMFASIEDSYFFIHHSFTNKDDGVIYSERDLFIAKDADGSKMDSFLNSSATVEAGRDLFIAANDIANKRTKFEIADRNLSEQERHYDSWRPEYANDPFCQVSMYAVGCSLYIEHHDETYEEKYVEDFTDESKLLSGRNMRLEGNQILNSYSKIAAGGNLEKITTNYTFEIFQSTIIKTESGYSYYHRWYPDGRVKNEDYQSLPIKKSTILHGDIYGSDTSNQTTTIEAKDINFSGVTPNSTDVTSVDSSKTNQGIEVTTSDGQTKIILVGDPLRDYQLPTSSFYTINNDPSAKYLVETNSRFTNYKSFLSSDYYFEHLGFDLSSIQKRLGDGFYEQRLVMDQILNLTGKRYLGDFDSTEDQFLSLLDNGIEFAQKFNIRPGMALSREQMSLLTNDIVWMEERIVQGQKVLVPVVYLAQAKDDIQANGGMISAKNVKLKATNSINNLGVTIVGESVSMQAEDITNRYGHIKGKELSIYAARDLLNESGLIEGETVALSAGRDLTLKTLSQTNTTANGSYTTFGYLGEVRANNLLMSAGRDISLYGASVSATNDATIIAGRNFLMDTVQATTTSSTRSGKNYSNTSETWHLQSGLTTGGDFNLITGNDATFHGAYVGVGGDATILSGGNITFDAVKETQSSDSYQKKHGTKTWNSTYDEYAIGSQLVASGNVTLAATGANSSINILGSYVGADTGAVTMLATNDVNIGTVNEVHNSFSASKKKTSGFLSSKSKYHSEQVNETDAIGSAVSGDTVSIVAGRDVNLTGSGIVGTGAVSVMAGRDLNINAAVSTIDTKVVDKEKRTGLSNASGNGRAGVSYGTTKNKTTTTTHDTMATGSVIASVTDDVTLVAGKNISMVGSDVMAGRDITMLGESVSISNATEQSSFNENYTRTQKGIVLGIKSPVISEAANSVEAAHRSTVVSDSRLQAVYDFRAARELNDVRKMVTDPKNKSSVSNDVRIEQGYMESKSHRESSTENTTVVASNVSAGRDMTIVSTQGDINIAGSNLAASNVVLASARDVILQSAANTSQSKYNSKTVEAEVGAFANAGQSGVSGGAYGDASLSKQNRNGNGTSYSETTVSAADTLTIISARDVTLEGAQASGNRIIADVGRNLSLVSQQDTAHFKQKEQTASVGGSVTVVGTGPSSVHGSYGQSNINSDYKSVQEQTGLFAGTGGFDIYVGNNTNLVGAVIASTADASKNYFSTETFSYSNLHNSYKTDSSNYGLAYQSGNLGGGDQKPTPQQTTEGASKPQYATPSTGGLTPSMGVASSDKDSSTTYSAVSNGTFEIRSGGTSDVSRDTSNANHPLENKFDLTKVEEQQELARVFGEEGFKVAGDVAEHFGWQNGSLEKVVLHSVVGGVQASLGGGNVFAGAAGAGMSEAMNGFSATWDKDAQQWASFAIGTAVGAVTGSYQTGGATALTAEQNNRQLHEVEISEIKRMAEAFAQKEGISVEEAEARLSAQALRQVDAMFADSHPGTDDEAAKYLATSTLEFTDERGVKTHGFQAASDADYYNSSLYFRTVMFNPEFYGRAYESQTPETIKNGPGALFDATRAMGKGIGNTFPYIVNENISFFETMAGSESGIRISNLFNYENAYEAKVGEAFSFITSLFVSGSSISKGVTSIRKVSSGAEEVIEFATAHNAAEFVKFKKSLASQHQMSEEGTIIAGQGSKIIFRDAARVAKEYGGESIDWVKKTSSSYTTSGGAQFETHWIENIRTGQRVEFKTKLKRG